MSEDSRIIFPNDFPFASDPRPLIVHHKKNILSLSSAAFYWAPAPLYVITDKTTIFYTIFHSRDFHFFSRTESCLDSRWLLYKKKFIIRAHRLKHLDCTSAWLRQRFMAHSRKLF